MTKTDFALEIAKYLKDYSVKPKSVIQYFQEKLKNINKYGPDLKSSLIQITISYIIDSLLKPITNKNGEIIINNKTYFYNGVKITSAWISSKIADTMIKSKSTKEAIKKLQKDGLKHVKNIVSEKEVK